MSATGIRTSALVETLSSPHGQLLTRLQSQNDQGKIWLLPTPAAVPNQTHSTWFDIAAYIATLCHYAMGSMLDDFAYYYYIIA